MSEKKCKCHEKDIENSTEKDCKCGNDCGCNNEHHDCGCHSHEDSCGCGDDCGCSNPVSKEVEYLELAQRIKAEFDNYKKRNADISKISFENGVSTAISKLLPAIDSFNQAKSNIKDSSVLSGIDLIFNQMLNAFESLGVKKIEAVGCLFDPNLHNAVLIENNENYPEDVVLEEYQAGFMMGDKVIRHSVVKINKLG